MTGEEVTRRWALYCGAGHAEERRGQEEEEEEEEEMYVDVGSKLSEWVGD